MRIRTLAALGAIALLPSALQAQCISWDASGRQSATQSNDTVAFFWLEQKGELLKGRGMHDRYESEDYCIGVSCDELVTYEAQVEGTIKGNSIQLTAYWNDGPIGVYTGTINEHGRAEGEAFDRNNPSSRATWYSGNMTCLAQAAPAAPPPAILPKKLGRVVTTDAASAGPEMSLCDRARSARARNSPAAPGLERQCVALGEKPAAPVVVAPTPTPTAELDAFAAAGKTRATRDPLAAQLAAGFSEPGQRGFYIGLAKVGNDTLPGPGKTRVHDSLGNAEAQLGFKTALDYSFVRNANVALVTSGAAMVGSDAELAEARTSGESPYFSQGFDIASGWFGSLADGGLGNRAMSPPIQQIRDSLNEKGRNGFDAGMKLHLARP